MKIVFSSLVALLITTSQSSADLVHNFDMNGDSSQFLHEVTNARIWDERPNGLLVRYWAPTTTGIEGSVTYRYSLDEPIQSASLYANLLTNRNGDRVWLDVSADGVNFTNLFFGEQVGSTTARLSPGGPNIPPPSFDLSSVLEGSATAYVRARMIGSQLNSDIFSSQFLRTADSNGTFISSFEAPNVYQFSAVTVPEPSMFATCMLFSGLAAFRRKRH